MNVGKVRGGRMPDTEPKWIWHRAYAVALAALLPLIVAAAPGAVRAQDAPPAAKD